MAYHVISIGVSKYKLPNYRDLDYAHADAIEFDRLLGNNLTDITYRKLLVDSEATLSEIRTVFNADELKEAGKSDAFFLFFSGHGAIDKTKDGYSTFLVPFDATADIASSSLSVDFLKELFEELPHGSKHMFIDCCYSGNASSKSVSSFKPKDGMKLKTIQDELTSEGTVVITACADSETAIESEQFEHGLFTYCLLDELCKARSGEQFPVSDVYTPVAEQVQKTAKDTFNHKQTPTIRTHLKGAVYLPVFVANPFPSGSTEHEYGPAHRIRESGAEPVKMMPSALLAKIHVGRAIYSDDSEAFLEFIRKDYVGEMPAAATAA